MPYSAGSTLTYEIVTKRAWLPAGPEYHFYRLTCSEHPDFVALCDSSEQVAAHGTTHFVEMHARRGNCPPDHPAEPDYRHEVQHCRLPATGDLGSKGGRRIRPQPHETLAQSYLRQRYRIEREGLSLWVEPGPPDEMDGPQNPAFIISAWSPQGTVANYQDNQRLHRRLRDQLSRQGHQRVAEIVGVAGDQSWFEAAHLVEDIDESIAVNLAAEFGQAAVVRWHRHRLTIIPTGVLPGIRRRNVTVRIRLAGAMCPLRDDELDGIQCVRRGGPWGSYPIHLYAVQLFHRSIALNLLGCEPCDAGRVHVMMQRDLQPHAFMALGSRHGGVYWP